MTDHERRLLLMVASAIADLLEASADEFRNAAVAARDIRAALERVAEE